MASIGNLATCALAALALAGCLGPQPGNVIDEAQLAGRDAASFPHADEDYFAGMDPGVTLTPDEVRGRNMWNVWTGGNDKFWDVMTTKTFGAFDLLKTISSHPSMKSGYPGQKPSRATRWSYLGIINEPCFEDARGPDPNRFGLWLDVRRADCPADPFANEAKYPGVRIGARGKSMPVGSFYGEPTGVVGLRLFPNPDFDEAARARWDPERYYSDPAYYNDPNLVRPYRIGMSCGFCHIGPSPLRPPADPARPAWGELNSSVGAQYMWVDRLFVYSADETNFMYQQVHTYRPGAMDTSLVSTDNINNPRTMNAVYNLGARLGIARRFGKETLAGGELNNRQFNDFTNEPALTQFFTAPDTTWTPHVLKDGADSVGALGALNRVYLNIGVFSEEWLLHFNAVAGGKPITPIEIAVAQRNSSYWRATEAGTTNMARFFLKAAQPDRLRDAPGGTRFLTASAAALERGKTVFAETCARCHSSKLPATIAALEPAGCAGPGYLDCWNRYWETTKTESFKAAMRAIVHAPDFLDGNYLSTELRVPVTLLETNACSPLATNALAGNIWNDFSSQSYKQLPSVGTITVHDPFTGEAKPYRMPAGGRGYTRPPSLVSLWSSAPFLLNNSLGPFNQDPSVEGRMKMFDAAIEQLLWPETRDRDPILGDKVPGVIDRTTKRSEIRIPVGYVPTLLQRAAGPDGIVIGPIPAGVPVNLIANLKPLPETEDLTDTVSHAAKVVDLLLELKRTLGSLPANATDAELRLRMIELREPMLALNKCPDFVVNRGHYFGTARGDPAEALSDSDKRALIEFLKTF